MQRQLEGELFDKWEEKYEETEAHDIPIADINQFLNHMEEAYEGKATSHVRNKIVTFNGGH